MQGEIMDYFDFAKSLVRRQSQAQKIALMIAEDVARIDPPDLPDTDFERQRADYEAEIAADKFEGRGT
jgi:hypothetical protein